MIVNENILDSVGGIESLQLNNTEKEKKREYNKKYNEKKKSELEELQNIKSQLGIQRLDLKTIQKCVNEKDRIIVDQELKIVEQNVEIEKLKALVEENSRDKALAIMNDRIGKLEFYEKRIGQLENKVKFNEGWFHFINKMCKIYPNEINETIKRLQKERLTTPLEPKALDKLVAEYVSPV